MRLKDLLKEKIPEEKLKYVPASFDIVGSRQGAVAIVEIPPELEEYENIIGEAILSLHRNVKAVYKKLSGRKGEFRIRELKLIAGEPLTEVLHKEHGYVLKLDVTKVYFSPREATERQRIASQVKPGEIVMVMFAGVGPYAIAIAKAQPRVEKIIAIEINPVAYKYMVENIRINKLEDKIIPVLGDVRDKVADWKNTCDRVVMPLPKGAHLFLNEAITVLKEKGGIIHFYFWDREEDPFTRAYAIVEKVAKLHGYRARLLSARKVLPYAPRIYKVVVDVELTREE